MQIGHCLAIVGAAHPFTRRCHRQNAVDLGVVNVKAFHVVEEILKGTAGTGDGTSDIKLLGHGCEW